MNAFKISTDKKTFVVIAGDENLKKEWMDVIDLTLENFKNKKMSFGQKQEKGDDFVAPEWITDEDSDSCMSCTTKFTFFVRRHHCRICKNFFFNFFLIIFLFSLTFYFLFFYFLIIFLFSFIFLFFLFYYFYFYFIFFYFYFLGGKLVCGTCSSNRMKIQAISTAPVRVCKECFEFSNNK